MNGDALRVLVVDDSAVVRESMRRALGGLPEWSVEMAADPIVALRRIRTDPPDVILLDLEMPRMDGLTFLRHLMALEPIPVVVLSSHANAGSEAARAALEAGAVEVLAKPELNVKSFLEGESSTLAETLRSAVATRDELRARWRPSSEGALSSALARGGNGTTQPPPSGGGDADPPFVSRPSSRTSPRLASPSTPPSSGRLLENAVVLVGASMGGPPALRKVLAALPSDGPPCIVVQHMMAEFTEAFVERLDGEVAVEVREAESGDRPTRGTVLVAPGGLQTMLVGSVDDPKLLVRDGPPVHGHRPSIDVLFRSAAEVLGPSAVAALLTGIGRDGAEGLLALRRAGAVTVAQDEATSTAFGMPGAAMELDAAEAVLPLERIGPFLVERAGRGGGSASTGPEAKGTKTADVESRAPGTSRDAGSREAEAETARRTR